MPGREVRSPEPNNSHVKVICIPSNLGVKMVDDGDYCVGNALCLC